MSKKRRYQFYTYNKCSVVYRRCGIYFVYLKAHTFLNNRKLTDIYSTRAYMLYLFLILLRPPLRTKKKLHLLLKCLDLKKNMFVSTFLFAAEMLYLV